MNGRLVEVLDKKEFAKRRRQLMRIMGADAIAILPAAAGKMAMASAPMIRINCRRRFANSFLSSTSTNLPFNVPANPLGAARATAAILHRSATPPS